MDELILKDKKSSNRLRLERKVFAIQETIMSLIRERSYVSPLLTNLGIHLHREYDSRYLNEVLEPASLLTYQKLDVLYLSSLYFDKRISSWNSFM